MSTLIRDSRISSNIASFGYSSRSNSFEKTEEDRNKQRGTQTNATHQQLQISQTTLAIEDSKEKEEGNSREQRETNITTVSVDSIGFGENLDNALITEKIVDGALKIVKDIQDSLQEIRDNVQKELAKINDFQEYYDSRFSPQGAPASAIMRSLFSGSMSLQFNASIVGGISTQQVNVNINFSQSFMQSNFKEVAVDSNNRIIHGLPPSMSKRSVKIATSELSATSIDMRTQIQSRAIQNRAINVDFNTFAGVARMQGFPNALTNVSLVDPLVIDLGGNGVKLSSDTFEFDLDSDGRSDHISRPTGGSGFLALDKNGDGKINDGSELFGTKSGDGFKDLAIYDENNDGKIDKHDAIFNKLRIWRPDAQGKGTLVGLGEVGIGAIYLRTMNSQRLIQNNSGELLGAQRKTAFYEKSDGTLGNVYHVDLAKRSKSNRETTILPKTKAVSSYQQLQDEMQKLREKDKERAYNKVNAKSETKEGEAKKDKSTKKEELTGQELLDMAKKEATQLGALFKQQVQQDLKLMQLEVLFGNRSVSSFANILDRNVFYGQLRNLNYTMFQYERVLRAQKNLL